MVNFVGKIRITQLWLWQVLFLVFSMLFIFIVSLAFIFAVFFFIWRIRFTWSVVWRWCVWLWVLWNVPFYWFLFAFWWFCLSCFLFWVYHFCTKKESGPNVIFFIFSVCVNRSQLQRWSTHWSVLALEFLVFFPNLKISFMAIVMVWLRCTHSYQCWFTKNMSRSAPMGSIHRPLG